ncbi:MAG: outer membrane efflux protein [Sulfurimonas sp.]|nr:MAG: outer membrane efflux protein [Sulfurimonas sp.]
MKKFIIIFVVLLIGEFTCTSASSVVRIGTVMDGKNQELTKARTLFIDEIKKVTQGEFIIKFPEAKQLDAQFSIDKMDEAIDKLQNDKEVDMVLLIGSIASQLSLKKTSLRKPTFSPFVFNISLSGFNNSNSKNLNYLTSEATLDEEIQIFRKFSLFKNIAVLIDESQYKLFLPAAKKAITTAKEKGVILTFITCSSLDKDLMTKIPLNTDAVMIAPLSWMDKASKKSLIQWLIEHKLPSYSLMGEEMVKEGLLVSSKNYNDFPRRARRTALNMLAVLHGEKASKQPVLFNEKKKLLINMDTARSIDMAIKFSLLENAVLLNEVQEKEPIMTLKTVAEEAIRVNLGIIANKLGVEANRENIVEVRSVLFPQIMGELSYSQLNHDSPYVENGFYAEKSTVGALRLQQLLFSEKSLASLEIQKQLQIAIEEQQKMLELEVLKQATTMFLNLLVAQTYHSIQLSNLALTRTNLELADGRVKAGTADISDIYYWQSTIATVKQNVLQTDAEVEKIKDQLNLILNRKISDRFITQPASLDNSKEIRNEQTILNMITDNKSYDAMEKFLLNEGLSNSPKLHELSAHISAQRRQLLSDERAYWSPNVALIGEASYVFDETRNPVAGISLENKADWQAMIKISLPFYEGGARNARTSRSQLKLQQLEVNYNKEKSLIEQRIRNDLHTIGASYPSIALSSEAAEAARKSFYIVRENYAQGTRSMSDLLTAQNASLIADQSSVNTVYSYMIDRLQLQRDIAAFDLFLDDSGNEKLLERMKSSINNERKEINK